MKASGAKDNFVQAQAELAAQTDALHERLESESVEALFKNMDKVKQDSVKLLAKVKFFGELGSDKIVPFIQYRVGYVCVC